MTTIREFQELAAKRSQESFAIKPAFTPLEWAGALAGEVGELANLVKKMRRGEDVDLTDVAREAGDVLGYLVLVADALGIDLQDAATAKFNEVSERVGSPLRFAGAERCSEE